MRCIPSNLTRSCLSALAVLLAGATLLAGCDFLDKSPKGQLTEANFFQDEDDAIQATNATYNELRDFSVHVFSWLGMTDMVSDDAIKGSFAADASFLLEFENLSWSPTQQAFRGTWGGYYSGIYRANVALNNIPDIDMDADLQSRLLAENRFLRAYYYFFLVRAYGGVPLLREPLQPDEFEQPRAPADSIYALIESDLQFAANNLPPRSGYPSSDAGRATQGAANGLLAKVHLFQEEYPEALTAAEEVITSTEYTLPDDYFTIFRQEGEFGSGSVFEVASAALETFGGSIQYAQFQGVRGTPNLGFGFNQPTDDLQTSYEPGDPRNQATILYPWEAIPDGSGPVVHINTNIPNQRYNEKAQAPLDTPGGSGNATVNVRRLRLGDVLLIAAEAAAETSQPDLARTYLNRVRERARDGRALTLGSQIENMPPQVAEVLGVSASGPHVMVRYADGSGSDAGLQSFSSAFRDGGSPIPAQIEQVDVIDAINGTEVTSVEEYAAALDAASAGQTVTLDVIRLNQAADGSVSSQTLAIDATAEELLPDVTASGQALIDAIWQERRFELALEQHRWFDLIRQGRAEEVMEGVGKTWQDRYTLYPIPQSEIDLSGGALTQNPGYAGG
jgi:hypothetical protein